MSKDCIAVSASAANREGKGDTRTFTITELAHEFDITPRAIRFYEDVGLLFPARSGRNRVYTQRDRTRLKLTLRGKRLGFALQEIKQLVTMYDTNSDVAPQLQAFLASLAAHREQLEQQREDIEITLAEIGQHEARCRSLLAGLARPTPSPAPSRAEAAAAARDEGAAEGSPQPAAARRRKAAGPGRNANR